jgi:hypothetical protein
MTVNGATAANTVFVRRSSVADVTDLARLAEAGGRTRQPRGVYLIAEIGGQIVAAVSLERAEAALRHPADETSDVEDLLRRWALKLRREARRLERRAA